MKTKYWVIGFVLLAIVCLVAMLPLIDPKPASSAEIYIDGTLYKTVSLSEDQEFSVEGHNTITVRDGAIAVTDADCPDKYCIKRGFRSGGADIVCLPNRVVIHFVADPAADSPDAVDSVVG